MVVLSRMARVGTVGVLAGVLWLGHAMAKNIVDTSQTAGTFGTWNELLRETGTEDLLKQPGPYTVFMPSDEAFAELPAAKRDALKNKDVMKQVVDMSIAKGKLLLKPAKEGTQISTEAGKTLTLHREGKVLKLNGMEVLEPDVEVDNGVIHVMKAVPFP